MKLFIDVETFSDIDLEASGVYPYFESPNFEILLVGYAIDRGPVRVFDFYRHTNKELDALFDLMLEADELIAHNASFERLAFKRIGLDLPAWTCTMIRSSYCGLPLSLDEAGRALDLIEKKLGTGKALINYFTKPCKPSKVNGGRTRNWPKDAPEKWQDFIEYLKKDVEAAREIFYALEAYPFTEQQNYLIDQTINDRGILIDLELVNNAVRLDYETTKRLTLEAKRITGLENPNSPAQLKTWLSERLGEDIENLAAATVEDLLRSASGDVRTVLQYRQSTSNTSVKKYQKAKSYACEDGRARGLFQFYGAGKTGRWAGRGIQLQNMPRNYMQTLGEARALVKEGDFEAVNFLYEDPQQVLKELTRTMLIPRPGYRLLIADFSAIEARVIAWLAGEKWRLEVFNTHGKIYEASAAMMFSVELESISYKDVDGKTQKGPNYEMRSKGKIAELALGYQGGVGALKTMGGEAMGLSESEMQTIVTRWRKANPAIKAYWANVEAAAVQAMKRPRKRVKIGAVAYEYDLKVLLCHLPSGRVLIYQSPKLVKGRFGDQIRHLGVDQLSRRWTWLDTYGGKLVENIVQAVARDLLAYSIASVEAAGFKIVLHVHDEIVVEEKAKTAEAAYPLLIDAMLQKPDWAEGLPLGADGFITDFYQKD